MGSRGKSELVDRKFADPYSVGALAHLGLAYVYARQGNIAKTKVSGFHHFFRKTPTRESPSLECYEGSIREAEVVLCAIACTRRLS
jgi:hypothetical protein